jgi:hypothetical protein
VIFDRLCRKGRIPQTDTEEEMIDKFGYRKLKNKLWEK